MQHLTKPSPTFIIRHQMRHLHMQALKKNKIASPDACAGTEQCWSLCRMCPSAQREISAALECSELCTGLVRASLCTATNPHPLQDQSPALLAHFHQCTAAEVWFLIVLAPQSSDCSGGHGGQESKAGCSRGGSPKVTQPFDHLSLFMPMFEMNLKDNG